MTFKENLKLHLRAGVPALYVESHEWLRFHSIAKECCADSEVKKTLLVWNPIDGFDLPPEDQEKDQEEEQKGERLPEGNDTMELLDFLNEATHRDTVYVLEHFDRYLEGKDYPAFLALAIRRLRDSGCHVVILSPTMNLPDAIRKEFTVLDFPLPDRDHIKDLLRETAEKHISDGGRVDSSPAILDSVRGLSTEEVRNAFSKAAVDCGRITAEEIPMLIGEKEQIIRKSGYLEFVRTEDAAKIGGLTELQMWLVRRKNAFGPKARDAKLIAPKGVLLLGIPGTGKSLCAKVVAREWKMPLLRLDMGSVFGSLVGESESNIRNAIKIAEGLEPCVLWIDEIEKGFSGGASSSGEMDGGTSTRVFGTFLTWMQEKDKEVFVFATANDLSRMPPELLRKGRFDEIFFVDLPGKRARDEIFRIHLERKGQEKVEPSDELVKESEGYSGSEIEAVVNEALFLAYESEQTPKVTAANLMQATKEIVPLSSTMGDVIKSIREWADKRCRKANDPADEMPNIRSDGAPRLRAEISNPFEKEKNE